MGQCHLEDTFIAVLHVPPQQISHLIITASFDVTSDLVRQIGRSRLDFGEKIGGGLVETVDSLVVSAMAC